MKKAALAIIMLLAFVNATAQFRYGLRLGGAFCLPTGDMTIDGGNGFAGGLSADYTFGTSNVGVALSVEYQRRNICVNTSDNQPFDISGSNFGGDFVSTAIDFRYHVPTPWLYGIISPYAVTGPDLAWRINSAHGRRFHVGWNLGAGIDIINFVRLAGGYRFGINNINHDGPTLHDSGAFVSVSLLFSI